jgi:hypothetical protein
MKIKVGAATFLPIVGRGSRDFAHGFRGKADKTKNQNMHF